MFACVHACMCVRVCVRVCVFGSKAYWFKALRAFARIPIIPHKVASVSNSLLLMIDLITDMPRYLPLQLQHVVFMYIMHGSVVMSPNILKQPRPGFIVALEYF